MLLLTAENGKSANLTADCWYETGFYDITILHDLIRKNIAVYIHHKAVSLLIHHGVFGGFTEVLQFFLIFLMNRPIGARNGLGQPSLRSSLFFRRVGEVDLHSWT